MTDDTEDRVKELEEEARKFKLRIIARELFFRIYNSQTERANIEWLYDEVLDDAECILRAEEKHFG